MGTPATSRGRRRIVGTSCLRSKPTSSVEAPTAFDFFNNPDVLQTTPAVEEGREDEYVDQLAYAFHYGSNDLLTYLKSTGLKMPEAAKLLDLEHAHEFYHDAATYVRLSSPRPRTPDPAPQPALIRRLGDRHQKIKPSYTDSDRVSDLWHVLSESAKKSPYVAPLYRVVLRELWAGHAFTFARLALRIRIAFQDESPLATLSPSATSDIPATALTGNGQKPPHHPPRPAAMALRAQKQSLAPLVGGGEMGC
ncbi:hypothetical protein CYMTET_43242 [Cymbomonas tetramitiformis]|uniref:Uncharacterized protein n=1 Tax=Cymbomonas tetramitiformis TaxID=36881 RepID=A0AAE0F066_9CHLO|nr:hypothetical protein CYMTET_43244 [Cymbomonas tetramitiformis]KAK3247253.1 hypothetical protein CYMTET_43242 [Cymbomonas tetramitiformis]